MPMPDALPMLPPYVTRSLADFLETYPPESHLHVHSLSSVTDQNNLIFSEGDVQLPCSTAECQGKGKLRFRYSSGKQYLKREEYRFLFVAYTCRNCRKTQKTYALALIADATGRDGTVHKLGETPAFGPEVPARVITLIGPDRELFLKGRRAENHGLGVGAFAYYRRVVENQKVSIIEELAKVARRLDASPGDLKLFQEAAKESQFTKAIDKIGAAIPSALRISGHNPLSLLHKALSDGLHERSDEECLECAREVRLLLTELADRMAQVLKEESELKGAVSKLLARTASKKKTVLEKKEEAINETETIPEPKQ
jgi:hypothetical protein